MPELARTAVLGHGPAPPVSEALHQLGRRPNHRHAASRDRDPRARFLPTTREEMALRGWNELDILIISGDAYVDHPAFGPVLVARFLEGRGFKVGIIAQPKWDSPADIERM